MLFQVSLAYATPILEKFGPELQQLEFKRCEGIKLADLSLCLQLENLRIIAITVLPNIVDSTVDEATFLPHLKSFESDVCLGLHSRLFEEKSTLVQLVLECSHVGVDSDEPLRKCFKSFSQVSLRIIYSPIIVNLN